jgi:presenilin-like A22 family membrane protease
MPKKIGTLLYGLAVFIATLGLAVLAARVVGPEGGYVPTDAVAVPYFLGLFLVATLVLILVLKLSKTGWPLQILFILAVLMGSVAFFDVFLPSPWSLLVGAAVAVAYYRRRSTLVANLSLVLALAGIAGVMASGLRPTAVVTVFTVLAFYDILAVYVTGHMVQMFRGLSDRGIQAAFVLKPPFAKAMGGVGDKTFYLGTGDVLMPAVLAASAARQSLAHGLLALLGALAGYTLMVWIFLTPSPRLPTQLKLRGTGRGTGGPMPALPPIAIGSIGFYLISLLLWP